MNEQIKNFWARSWSRNWLGGLLVSLAAATIVAVIGGFAGLFPVGPELLAIWLIWVLCLWPLILFVRWLCCWRNFKKFAFAVLCLITFIALIGAEETWRGKRALENFKREWSARGENFDLKTFVPPVPDEKNFALAPIVASSYETYFDQQGHEKFPRDTNIVDRLSMLYRRELKGFELPKHQGWMFAKKTDLKPWQEFFRTAPALDANGLASISNTTAQTHRFSISAQPQSPAADVMMALAKYDAPIAELRQAAALPESRFPLTYLSENPAAILLPHLAALKACGQTLALRASAELELGQTEEALADTLLILRLTESVRTEPVLISHLVRIALVQILLRPVYDGLVDRKWSEAQLKTLDAALAKMDLPADYLYALRGERTLGMGSLDFIRRSRDMSVLNDFQNLPSAPRPAKTWRWLSHLIVPDGFFYQNELMMARLHQQFMLPMVDATNHVVTPANVHALQRDADAELMTRWSPYKIFARLLFPALEPAAKNFTYGQASLDLARIAIALERFRLARGSFPDSLEQLAPQILENIPHDIIKGGPLKYRRQTDGNFVLYSIGWNETDDGGTVVFTKGDGPAVDSNKGDWVWRYPAK